MGNILNQIRASTTPEHCHPKQNYLGRVADAQFEPWSILICRAISEHTRRIYNKGIANDHFELWSILVCRAISEHACRIHKKGAANDHSQLLRILICRAISECILRKLIIYENGTAIDQFQLWSILICRTMSYYISHKPIYEKRIADAQFQLLSILICRAISDYLRHKPMYKKEISIDRCVNIPEDVLCTILSKLPLNEVVRTDVLSSKWRCLWTVCPKLSFDGVTMFGKSMHKRQRKQYTQKFIDNVNAVLQQCHGRVVEELAVKFEFDTMLVNHLNNWIRFAVSSHTKFLAFDLTPSGFEALDDDPQYIFPFQLLDNKSISRLQHIQLCFVSVKPPAQFTGFPNLTKLCLSKVHVNAKDLQHMLSNCCNLEWLSILYCYLDGELKVDSPLPRLLYLNVSFGEPTKIEFRAVELRTFVYQGSPVPIHLNKVSELENANIHFVGGTIEHAMPALANVLTNVQNLTFKIYVESLEVPCLLENSYKFAQLKHLQVQLFFTDDIHYLSLVTFMGAAPFIEKLEMHFTSIFGFFCVEGTTTRKFEHPYKYLKDVSITGFKASSGQVELLVYIVENTPALKVLTIDQLDRLVKEDAEEEAKHNMDAVYRVVRRYIEGKVSPKCCVRLF